MTETTVPITLDANPANEIKADAPRAIGHTASDAAQTRATQLTYAQAVADSEAAAPVGAREPGDHAETSETTYTKSKKGSG